jgi:hypothetical protein
MKTKTKRRKIEIGTTLPYFHDGRLVTAEVVDILTRLSRRLERWWTVRLTDCQQPVVRGDGEPVDFQAPTRTITANMNYIESLPRFTPARHDSAVVQWIDVPGSGLWCEVRLQHKCGRYRNTHWDKSEWGTVEALIASGEARRARKGSFDFVRWFEF